MRELKRCPLCNSELELDTDKRFYIHPLVGCYFDCLIIKADNENSIEKWNTRKPMQNIVERLREKSKEPIYQHHGDNYYVGIYDAIGIVKEEGGIDE